MFQFRKVLSVLLSFTLVFSLVGLPAYADEYGQEEETEQDGSVVQIADEQRISNAGNELESYPDVVDSANAVEDQAGVSEEEPSQKNTQNQDADMVVQEDKGEISFLYIANDEVVIGGQQEFAFALSDESKVIKSAQLKVRSLVSGEESIISNDVVHGNAASFVTSVESMPLGTIVVESVSFLLQGDDLVHEVNLSDKGYSFEITENGDQREAIVAYYQDESGRIVETDDLDAALGEVVGAEGEISPFTLESRATGNAVASPVIALDPGHGGSDPGAVASGLRESDLTWKIAVACKDRLESYGFTVVLTRGENDDVNGDDYLHRVERVLRYGAEVYVSLHINSATASAANGVEVYVPSNSGSRHTQVSAELADKIIANLEALGLYNRGVKVEDEFAVINQSNSAGIPGILIEHGFITNSSDVSNYFSDEGCRELGWADADAIARQFPQSAWVDYSPVYDFDYYITHNSDLLAHFGSDDPEAVLDHFLMYGMREGRQAASAFNVDYYRQNYDDLRAAYGEDLKKYYIHYIDYGQEEGRVADRLLEKEPIAPVSLSATPSANRSTVAASASGGLLGSAESAVFAVWSDEGGQDDLEWYWATRASDGSWRASIPVADHASYGSYNVHAYATPRGSSGLSLMGTTTFSIEAPSATVSVDNVNEYAGTFVVSLRNIVSTSGVKRVEFPIWSASDQSDIVWYVATRQSDGSYQVTADIKNHLFVPEKERSYTIHAYLTDGNGIRSLVDMADADITYVGDAS